jgi:hypothetical protein
MPGGASFRYSKRLALNSKAMWVNPRDIVPRLSTEQQDTISYLRTASADEVEKPRKWGRNLTSTTSNVMRCWDKRSLH